MKAVVSAYGPFSNNAHFESRNNILCKQKPVTSALRFWVLILYIEKLAIIHGIDVYCREERSMRLHIMWNPNKRL